MRHLHAPVGLSLEGEYIEPGGQGVHVHARPLGALGAASGPHRAISPVVGWLAATEALFAGAAA